MYNKEDEIAKIEQKIRKAPGQFDKEWLMGDKKREEGALKNKEHSLQQRKNWAWFSTEKVLEQAVDLCKNNEEAQGHFKNALKIVRAEKKGEPNYIRI